MRKICSLLVLTICILEWRAVIYIQGLPEYRRVIRNVGHATRL